MAEVLKKAAVAQFLEAVKNSLSHLGELKLEIANEGRSNAAVDEHTVMQLYSRARRIREYLRRWMSAYPTPDSIQLPEGDLNLLCSCLVFELGRADKRAAAQSLKSKEDAAWIEKRKEILVYWAVQLATEPIEPLPTLWGRQDPSYDIRQVLVAVRRKTSTATPNAKPSGIYRLGAADTKDGAEGEPAPKGPPRLAAPLPGAESPGTVDVATPQTGIAGTEAPVAAPGPDPRPAVAASQRTLRPRDVIDTSRVRDYRLRLAMALDLRSLERCVEAEDYRLAMVLLDTILEGMLIDHGLSNSSMFALDGAPSQWSIGVILAGVLERDFGDRERMLFELLQRSRSLLRPAQQLTEPVVVNRASVHEAALFVRQVAECIGMVGEGGGRTRAPIDVF